MRTITAVRNWQKRNATAATGFLNPEQRAVLAASAARRREAVGWRVVDDSATGARLGLPAKLAPQIAAFGSGSRWSSVHGDTTVETFRVHGPETTLANVFAEMRRANPQREISYSVLRETFFAISGLQGLKKFYTRAEIRNGDVRGVTVAYDQGLEATMDKVAVAMSSAFAPFAGSVAAFGAPVPQHQVLYGTGVVVNRTGDILTDAQLVGACRSVSVGSLGRATVTATDETSGLALLHAFTPSALRSARLGAAPPAGPVSLTGIADPQSQDGGGAATTVPAQIVTRDGVLALERMPDSGFAGAAVVDGSGAFAGLVRIPPQALAQTGTSVAMSAAKVIPAATIEAFLRTQNIDAAATAASGITDSLVRVICVRPDPDKN